MLARCLKMIYLDYSFTAPLPMQVEAIDALIDPAVSPILGSAMALIPICFAMSGWVRRHQIPLISRGVLVLVCGVSFGRLKL